MKKFKLLAVTLLAALSLGLTSCDKDKDYDYQSATIKNGEYFLSKHEFGVVDTAGYKLNFRCGIVNGNVVVECFDSEPEFPHNAGASNYNTAGGVYDAGKVKGMTLIESKPADASFTSTSAKAEKKHGYVIKIWGADETYPEAYEQHPEMRPPSPVYVRLWIADEDDGSYEIRYEYPWK